MAYKHQQHVENFISFATLRTGTKTELRFKSYDFLKFTKEFCFQLSWRREFSRKHRKCVFDR